MSIIVKETGAVIGSESGGMNHIQHCLQCVQVSGHFRWSCPYPSSQATQNLLDEKTERDYRNHRCGQVHLVCVVNWSEIVMKGPTYLHPGLLCLNVLLNCQQSRGARFPMTDHVSENDCAGNCEMKNLR